MSPRLVFEEWVSQHATRFIAYAFALGVAWTLLTAAVNEKADREEVQRAESHVNAKIDSVSRKVDAVMYLLCRQPANRTDSVCQP